MSCPICDKQTAPEYRPFCSRRCADLDLGNWLGGRYSLPAEDARDTGDPAQAPTTSERKLH